jgi:hypothetical protein
LGRRGELDRIASFLGNAAAHAALLPDDPFARKEVTLYSSDAGDLFMAKQWNESELSYLKDKALKRAKNEILARIRRYGFDEKKAGQAIAVAESFIDDFLAGHKS